MSQSKLDELTAELEELRTVRKPAIAEQMNVARTRGGADDNGETDLAKQDLAFVEGKIRSLESLIGNAVVRQIARAGDNPPDTVAMWAVVTVERENGQQVQYQITGSLEADPGQGRISHVSPIGKSLLGKRPGDITEVQIPSGKTKLKIVSVS
jgi:transcription elongation factor GreA